MEKITLGQLLQYSTMKSTPVDRIQIVPQDQDWDVADELSVTSEILVPFLDWVVTDMSCELSFIDQSPILRVGIEPKEVDEWSTAKNWHQLDISSWEEATKRWTVRLSSKPA